MLAITQASRALRPQFVYGIAFFFLLGFYLGYLFVLGTLAALILTVPFFRGKFRFLVAMAGGFSGLAAWITVLLNHREHYDRVVLFLCKYLAKNWAVLLTDSSICVFGSLVLVGSLVGTRKSASKMVAMVTGRASRGSQKEPEEEQKSE